MGSRRRQNIREVIAAALDRTFQAITRSVNAAIASDVNSGVIQTRLDDIQGEAERLKEAGAVFSPSNPVLRALIADLVLLLSRQSRRIDGVSSAIQNSGIDAANRVTPLLAFGGLSAQQIASLGYAWNQPSLDTLRAAADFTNRDEWSTALGAFRENILRTVNNAVVQGIARGKSPLFIARHVSDLVKSLPLSRSNTLMRTLQLNSYRVASTTHELANSRILEKKIRIAALDDRTCLACIALHGTDMRIGETVRDHHNGRCTAILVPNGRSVNLTTGVEWFNALPDDRKLKIAGSANFEAMKTNKVQLQDFVGTYQDDLFGEMVREMSLVGILGNEARQYYARAS